MKIEILQATFSGITTLAALTGAVVVILGLNAWKKQLRKLKSICDLI